MNKYHVKIEDSVLPKSFTFDQLLEAGILDYFDEKVKVKLESETGWVTAREYPFSTAEGTIPSIDSTISSPKENPTDTPPSITPEEVDVPKKSDSATIHQTRISKESKPKTNRVRQNVVEANDDKPSGKIRWSWGAFSLSWIWSVCNGIYWPLAIIICNLIPYVGVLFSVGICVYLGLKGKEMARESASKNGISESSFESSQRTWDEVGIMMFVLGIAMLMIFVF